MKTLNINGQDITIDAEDDTPLLWAIRDHARLTGTKFGCGLMQCGACSVLIDGQAQRTCMLPLAAVNEGQKIITIEGLSDDGLSALQRAWIEFDVSQCGYCQSGMIISATALLNANHTPSDAEIDAAMTNICRCGSYQKVRLAIKKAAEEMSHA